MPSFSNLFFCIFIMGLLAQKYMYMCISVLSTNKCVYK